MALYEHVQRTAKGRKTTGIVQIVSGGLVAAAGGTLLGLHAAGRTFFSADLSQSFMLPVGSIAAGAALLTTGILQLTLLRTPQERLWTSIVRMAV